MIGETPEVPSDKRFDIWHLTFDICHLNLNGMTLVTSVALIQFISDLE